MSSKTKEAIKREFDAFAAKVARLESLRQQFEALDVKGFEADARAIRAKLNDIHSIDQLGRDIEALRRKISHRGAPSPETRHDHEKMMALSQYLERKTEELRAKINDLEKRIAEKRRVAVKKQLSNDEVASVHDIPKLEKELGSLRTTLASHLQSRRVKVDAGVGLIVDTKFDDFVASIKAELSERLKQKESVMSAELKADVRAQETLFAEKYASLVDEFHKRYQAKVHDELRAEVKRRFEKELHVRLEEEKRKLVDKLIHANARRLHAEKKRLVDQMHTDLTRKEQQLERMFHRAYRQKSQLLRVKLSQRFKLVRLKLATIDRRKKTFDRMQSQMERAMEQTKGAFDARSRALRVRVEHREKILRKQREALQKVRTGLLAQRTALLARTQTAFASRVRHMHAEQAAFVKEQMRLFAQKKEALAARSQTLSSRDSARRKHMERLMVRLREQRARFLAKQKAAVAAEHEKVRALFQKKLALVARKSRHFTLMEQMHARRHAALRLSLQRESAAVIQKKRTEFKALQEEHATLQRERILLHKKLTALQQHERTALEAHKHRLTQEIKERARVATLLYEKKVAALQNTLHQELKKRIALLNMQHDSDIAREVHKRELEIRSQLEHDYHERLKHELAKREITLQKKKELLERHVMEHLKKVLS